MFCDVVITMEEKSINIGIWETRTTPIIDGYAGGGNRLRRNLY